MNSNALYVLAFALILLAIFGYWIWQRISSHQRVLRSINIAITHGEVGRFSEAVHEADNARYNILKANEPTEISSVQKLGQKYSDESNLSMISRLASDTLSGKLDPGSSKILFAAMRSVFLKDEWDDAATRITKVVREKPAYPIAHLMLGYIYTFKYLTSGQGKSDAISVLQHASKLDHTLGKAYDLLADVHGPLGRGNRELDECCHFLNKMRLHAANTLERTFATLELIAAYEEKGELEKAKDLVRLVDKKQCSGEILRWLRKIENSYLLSE